MARPAKEPVWLEQAIDAMVRQGISLRQAAADLGQVLSPEEAEDAFRRRSFSRLLWAARNRYFVEIAEDPERTKAAKVGQLEILAKKLDDQGDFDKSAEVIFKIAKIEGWLTPDSTVNVYGSLTAKELADVRKAVQEGKSPATPPN